MDSKACVVRSGLVLAAAMLVAACGTSAGSSERDPLASQPTQQVTRYASLDGAQETPGSMSAARGAGVLSFDPGSGRIAGFVVTTGVTGTAAHIHVAPRGVAGGIIVPLVGGPDVYVIPDGATLPPANGADLNAGNLYFNVHSAAYPEGEIRGQIDLTPTATRFASLNGAQEVPANGSQASGGGILAIDEASGRIAGFVVTTGVTGTAAHVHAAPRGTAGGIIVPMVGGPGVWVIADGATLPAANMADLMAGNLYYNVHSEALPEGEIRGQLDVAPTATRFASLDAAQETPPSASGAVGGGVLAIDTATARIAGFVVSVGVPGTAAHIHPAARGVAGPILVPMVGGPGTYSLPDGATLPQANVAEFEAGNLYYNVHSAAYPAGEIRGQIDRP